MADNTFRLPVARVNCPNLVLEGDSELTGDYASSMISQLVTLSNFKNYSAMTNYAVSGRTAGLVDGGYSANGGLKKPSFTITDNSILFVWCGVNDLRSSVSAVTTFGYLTSVWAKAKLDGFLVVAFTVGNFTGNGITGPIETERLALNVLIRASAGLYDILCDVDTLFPDGTYKTDGLHLSTPGNAILAAWINANVPPGGDYRLTRRGGRIDGVLKVLSPDNDPNRVILQAISNNGSRGWQFNFNQIKNLTTDMFLDPGSGKLGINRAANACTYELDLYNGEFGLATLGKTIHLAEGANAVMGQAVLNGTTAVVIPTTAASANMRVFLSYALASGTIGMPYHSATVAGTSFSIKSVTVGDVNTVNWLILKPY